MREKRLSLSHLSASIFYLSFPSSNVAEWLFHLFFQPAFICFNEYEAWKSTPSCMRWRSQYRCCQTSARARLWYWCAKHGKSLMFSLFVLHQLSFPVFWFHTFFFCSSYFIILYSVVLSQLIPPHPSHETFFLQLSSPPQFSSYFSLFRLMCHLNIGAAYGCVCTYDAGVFDITLVDFHHLRNLMFSRMDGPR